MARHHTALPMVYLNRLMLPTFKIPKGPEQCSQEFKDFVKQCLTIDPFQRPDIDTISKHPFLNFLTDAKAKEVIQHLYDSYKEAKAMMMRKNTRSNTKRKAMMMMNSQMMMQCIDLSN